MEKSRHLLNKIGQKEINDKDLTQVSLFNRAVYRFNSIAPRHPVPELQGQILKSLIEEAMEKPALETHVDLLKNPSSCTKEKIDHFLQVLEKNQYLSELTNESIRNFEKAGGQVIILPAIPFTETWNYCLGIKDETLFPVCHAGLVRSQILRLVAKNLFSEKQLKVQLAHGIAGGCDDSTRHSMEFYIDDNHFRNQFPDAFGVVREPRFGEKETQNKQKSYLYTKEFFEKNYYAYHSSERRRVYLAFWDTGLSVIYKLLSTNVPNTSNNDQNPSPLKGITVVLIPEKDWISNIQPIPKVVLEIQKQCQRTLACPLERKEYPLEIRREVLWWISGLTPLPDDWEKHLEIFVPEILKKFPDGQVKEHKLKEFFMTEAYRAAFWRFSTLFNR